MRIVNPEISTLNHQIRIVNPKMCTLNPATTDCDMCVSLGKAPYKVLTGRPQSGLTKPLTKSKPLAKS